MVHLHVRSQYSLLKGTMSLSTIVDNAKNKEITAICLSDFHSMHSAFSFYKQCVVSNIKPLIGMEVHVSLDEDSFYVNVIAMNYSGYQDLLKLCSAISIESLDKVSFDRLKDYVSNCYVILMNGGNYEKALIQDIKEELEKYVALMASLPNAAIGLCHGDSPLQRKRHDVLEELASKYNLLTPAVSRILYEKEGDEELLQVLRAIDEGSVLATLPPSKDRGRFFRGKSEMEALYSTKALEDANSIAELCSVELKGNVNTLPKFPLANNVDSETYLRQLCYVGLKKRLNNKVPKKYEERLNFELSVIESMHFADYFLIVYDYVRYARTQKILVGAGRGSAAGSLVAYVLGITHVDPLAYDLLFERFLNPERISMPDIDIDFPDNRREEVIEYVKNKYGEANVSHIATFGTLKAKQVLRDVGRVLEISSYDIELLTKKIPSTPTIKLADVYASNKLFAQAVESKASLKKLYAMALRLEGLPRHISTHAAGIIVADQPLVNSVPLVRIEEGVYATQYPVENLEELGLWKMDFLGLRNLSIIDGVLSKIKSLYNEDIDIMKIPLDDTKTLNLLHNVDTIGVFQLESDGMKNLLSKMKVTCFDDIVASVALFRPGPMENIPEYIKRKENNTYVSIHPSLDSILKPTHGIIIYQEQIMMIAQTMAGFSLAKADVLRRAMSKKKESELIVLQDDFIKGSMEHGYSKDIAVMVYELILKFANYGFNKSHSVAYGLIAYQMAYLKANYPLVFFESLLNSVIGSEYKTYEYMEEAKRIGLQFLPFNVNESKNVYTIEVDGLRPPLSMIKNVGGVASQEIQKELELRGKFKNYFDFIARINTRKVNRKVIESLIDAGALDCFGYSRKTLLMNLEEALQYGDLVRIEEENQIRLDFDLVSEPVLKVIADRIDEKCEREKDVLGFYYSTHPLQSKRESLDIKSSIAACKKIRGKVMFIGILQRVKEHRTKNGEMMAFMNVSDELDNVDVVVMPNIYRTIQGVKRNTYVIIHGVMEDRGSVLVKEFKIVE